MRVPYLRDALHARIGVQHERVGRVAVCGKYFFSVRTEEDGRYLGGGAEGVQSGSGGCIPDVHGCVVCAAA